jgi:filamentous hemagglutinin
LELAPDSQGFHQLQARFENIPASMWADFPAGAPRPTGPINLIEGEALVAARAAAKKINGKLSRGFKLGPAGVDIHEIVPLKFGGSPTDLANKVGLHESVHSRVTTWFGRLQRLLEGR